jgi:hypothetical protein
MFAKISSRTSEATPFLVGHSLGGTLAAIEVSHLGSNGLEVSVDFSEGTACRLKATLSSPLKFLSYSAWPAPELPAPFYWPLRPFSWVLA